MVKKIILLIFLYFIPNYSFSASLNAIIDHDNISLGESFTLTIKLSNANALSNPSLNNLDNSLEIVSQSKSSSTQIINGNRSSSILWDYVIIAKKEGKHYIEPVPVETSQGTLYTQRILLDIKKNNNSFNKSNQEQKVTVTATVSKDNIYKNESIVYTIKILSHNEINNISIGDISIEGGIITAIDKPDISQSYINGVPINIIEAKYIFTPLEAKKFTIPSIVVQADVAIPLPKNNDPFQSSFRNSFSIFNSLSNFNRFQTYAFGSNEININVKDSKKAINPWIPASSFKISSSWKDLEDIKTGDPISLTITTLANGITMEQVPSLDLKNILKDSFKIYSDSPVSSFAVNKNSISSWREEKFTLIPQKSGSFIFPEIKIAWWNTKNNNLEYSIIPKKVIKVLRNKNAENDNQSANISTVLNTQDDKNSSNTNISSTSKEGDIIVRKGTNTLLYLIIFFLIFTLFVLIFIIYFMQKKILSSKNSNFNIDTDKEPIYQKEAKLHHKAIGDCSLDNVDTPEKLKHFLQEYAYKNWGISKNENLESIFQMAIIKSNFIDKDRIFKIQKEIEDALYANKVIDINIIKKDLLIILNSKKKEKKEKKKEKLPNLNPS